MDGPLKDWYQPLKPDHNQHGKPLNPLPEHGKAERKLHFQEGDLFSPITDLHEWDRVLMTDTNGREYEVIAGQITSQTHHGSDGDTEVEYRLLQVLRVEGLDLTKEELIIPGIYLKGDSKKVRLDPLSRDGKAIFNAKEGLRLNLSPFKGIRVAPHKIEITPYKSDAEIQLEPGRSVMMDIFQIGDSVKITDYKGRRYTFRVGDVRDGKVDFMNYVPENRTVIGIAELQSNIDPAILRDIEEVRTRGNEIVFVSTDKGNVLNLISPGETTKIKLALGFRDKDGVTKVTDELTNLPKIQMSPSHITITRSQAE